MQTVTIGGTTAVHVKIEWCCSKFWLTRCFHSPSTIFASQFLCTDRDSSEVAPNSIQQWYSSARVWLFADGKVHLFTRFSKRSNNSNFEQQRLELHIRTASIELVDCTTQRLAPFKGRFASLPEISRKPSNTSQSERFPLEKCVNRLRMQYLFKVAANWLNWVEFQFCKTWAVWVRLSFPFNWRFKSSLIGF